MSGRRRRTTHRVIADPTRPRPAAGSGAVPLSVPVGSIILSPPAHTVRTLTQGEKIEDTVPFRIPRSPWDEPARFQEISSYDALCLWSALNAKLAYISDGSVLTTVAGLVGATSSGRVTDLGEGLPKGHFLVFDKFVVIAIQGMTQQSQLQAALDQNAAASYSGYVATGDVPTVNALAYPEIAHASWPSKWMGWYFPLFVTQAIPWITWIRDQIESWGERKIYLIGHSLGGAVCEVIANYFSNRYLRPQTRAEAEAATESPFDSWRWEGGYTFGQPKTCLVHSLNVGAPGCSTLIASKMQEVAHPYDPIPRFPLSRFTAPWWYRIMSNVLPLDLGHYVKPAPYLRGITLRSADGGELPFMPNSRSSFLDYVHRYHGINKYLDEIRKELEREHREMRGDLLELWDAIRPRSTDEYLP